MPVLDADVFEEGGHGNIRKMLASPAGLLTILGFIILMLGRGRIGIMQFDAATIYGFGLITIVWLGGIIYFGFLHHSRKVLWNGGFAATDGRIEQIPHTNYGLIRLDVFDVPPFHAPKMMSKGALIFPLAARNHMGMSIAITIKSRQDKLDELPDLIRDYIERTNVKGPYHFGLIDSSQYFDELEDPTLGRVEAATLAAAFNTLTQEYNWISNLLQNKYNSMTQAMDAFRSIVGHTPELTTMEKARRFFGSKKEGEA